MVILSPLLPPARGGLADHTHHLAATLARHREVHVVTSPGANASDTFRIHSGITDWRDAGAVRKAVESIPGSPTLLWQYVPHMYGRGGVNLAVPSLVEGFRRSGRRQVVIAHEIQAPLHWKPHWMAYAIWHRIAWKRIRRCADAVGVSTEAWIERWRDSWTDIPGRDVFLVPSPSNFPVVPQPDDHRARWRASLGLGPEVRVLAYFGTLSAAKQPDWVFAAWRSARAAGIPTALAVIGGRPEPKLEPGESDFYRPLGFLDADQVSGALQAIDLLLLPFEDGVSERRTTITAGLAHGTPILTTRGHGTGSTLRSADFLRSTPAGDPTAFRDEAARLLAEPDRLRELSTKARQAYAEAYSWDVVASRLLRRLP